MAQVILIENNSTLHELIALNLTTYVGADVIPRKNAADAIGAKITLKNRTDREGTVASLVIPHKI